MQSIALVSLAAGFGLFANIHDAHADSWLRVGRLTKIEDFVDRGFARSVWTTVQSRAELEALEARHCSAPSVAAMKEKYPRPQTQKTYVEYARSQKDTAGDLAKCIDIRAVMAIFQRAYFQAQLEGLRAESYPANWPPLTDQFCEKNLPMLVLSESCSDIPDWRTDAEKADDAQLVNRKKDELPPELRG